MYFDKEDCIDTVELQGLQGRMVLVVNFLVFLKLNYFALLLQYVT